MVSMTFVRQAKKLWTSVIHARPSHWTGIRAASDNVTHSTWILAAVALGVLTVGAIAIPGGPVYHWLQCNIHSISDIDGNSSEYSPALSCRNATTSSLTTGSTNVLLLGNSGLSFSDSWNGIWSGVTDTSSTPVANSLGASAGVYESLNDVVIGGTIGPQALLTYETPSTTYQTFTFTGYSYNGSITTALPVIEALVDTNGTITPEVQTWKGPPSTAGSTESSETQTISLPQNTIGIAWGLEEESGTYFAAAWDFTVQNPTLTTS